MPRTPPERARHSFVARTALKRSRTQLTMVLRWRTTVSIAANDARSIAAHVDTLAADRGPASAHAACALVKLAYASPHHRSKIIQAGALKPLVEVLRDGAESGGGPGFSAVGAACQVVGVLAHDPGMAEIIVAAGASAPLVELLSTEAAAAAATAIQTLATNGVAFAPALAPLRRLQRHTGAALPRAWSLPDLKKPKPVKERKKR